MRLSGLAALAVLVGGAMFGVGSLGHKSDKKKVKVARKGARDRAGLAALAGAAERIERATPEPDHEPDDERDVEPESPPELELGPADEEEIQIELDELPEEPAAPARWVYASGTIDGPGSHDFTPVYVTRGGETIARAYTDERGGFSFELDANDPDPITISAETSDGWAGETTVVPAQAERGVRVRLATELADVTGTITDGAGRPVAFVEILDGDQVLGSSGAEGEFSVRLHAHRNATLTFDSFGTVVARTQVITRQGGPPVKIVAAGRTVSCAIATATRALEVNGVYMSVSREDGGGWSMGRGGFVGQGMADVSVIPGPNFQSLDIDIRGQERGVSAHMGADGRCAITESRFRHDDIID